MYVQIEIVPTFGIKDSDIHYVVSWSGWRSEIMNEKARKNKVGSCSEEIEQLDRSASKWRSKSRLKEEELTKQALAKFPKRLGEPIGVNSQPKPTHLVLWKRQRACVMMNLENMKRKWRERCDRHLMQALNSAQHVFYPKTEQSILHSPWHKQNGQLQKPKKLSLSLSLSSSIEAILLLSSSTNG